MMHNYFNVDYSETEIKTTAQATLPEGYVLVEEGRSQVGDIPFYGESLTWSEVPINKTEVLYLDLPIEAFFALARKQAN